MVRGFLLVFLVALCAASSLTVIKAPTLPTWKLAIAVGEYGHWFWAGPIVLAGVVALAFSGATVLRWSGWGLCGATLVLLCVPAFQAHRLAARLPQQLAAAFGEAEVSGEPFSLLQLFVSAEPDVPVRRETKIFSQPAAGGPLSLDFYYAAGKIAAPAPCVVVIHGGGWDGGDRLEFESFNRHLARQGFAVAAIDYRLAPGFTWPAQREDGVAALTYLRENHMALGIDPQRFVVFGRSAGGQIAEVLAYVDPVPGVRGVISFYAPADLYFAWNYTKEADLLNSFLLMRQYLGGTPETVPEAFTAASPYLHLRRRAVPALLGHGQLDGLVWHRQSERLASRLRETTTPVVFLDLPWATHAFDYNPRGPSGQLSAYAIEWFVRAVTRPEAER